MNPYTIDGSEPTETHGSIFSQPLALRSTITFRAVAYTENYLASDIATQTYIFLNSVLQQSTTGLPPLGWPEGPINGQYWGLFQTQERPEADFAAIYFGGDAEDYDVIKTSGIPGGYAIEATDGDMDAWSDLWDLAVALDINPTANANNYWTMQGLRPDGTRDESLPVLLDVNNLIDYMLIIFYIGDTDAPMSSFVGEKGDGALTTAACTARFLERVE